VLWRHVDIYCFLDRGAILTSVRGSAGVGVADGRPAAHVKSEAVLAYKVLRGDAPRYVVTVISPRSADPRRRLAWSTNTPLGWRRGVVVSGVRQ